MAEIFPRGYIGLREWIEQEVGSRFTQSTANRRFMILDELSEALATNQASFAIAIPESGQPQTAPSLIWLKPESERRKMLETGAASFIGNTGRLMSWRIGIWKNFTLAPKRMTGAEKLARIAEGQRTSMSLSDAPGTAPDIKPSELPAFTLGERPTTTGLAGRPSQKSWIQEEHERRCAEGIALLILQDEARAILNWLPSAHPGEPRYPTLKTVKNLIRSRHRDYKARKAQN